MIVSTTGLGPDETLYFGLDWTAALAPGATIQSSTWTSAGNSGTGGALAQTMTDGAFQGNVTRIKLSGGTVGVTYYWKNTITTSASETQERTLAVGTQAK